MRHVRELWCAIAYAPPLEKAAALGVVVVYGAYGVITLALLAVCLKDLMG